MSDQNQNEPPHVDDAGEPWDAHTALGFVICIVTACLMALAAMYAIRYFALTLPSRVFLVKP